MLKVNTSLLVPDAWKDEKDGESGYPYVAKFRHGEKKLSYLAATHENSINSKTFQLIAKEFREFNPEVSIIEGLASESGFSPENHSKSLKEIDLSRPIWGNGEPSYAAALALKNNIPYIGGEPGKHVKDTLYKRFTAKDLAGYYVILQIPYWSRMNTGKTPDFNNWFKELMVGLKKSSWIDQDIEFTADEFTRWYESKHHIKFEFNKINSDDSAPISGENALFTQKIGFQLALLRDMNILQVITDMLNKFNRVLVVYGGGHYAAQKAALADMLGQPE